MNVKPKICRVCKAKFMPIRSTLEPVCSNNDCRLIYALNYAKKQREQKEKSARKQSTLEKSVMKEKLKTLSEYKADLQKEINTLVREIDKGHLCISSRKPLNSKFDAGHFYSRGSNPAISFNLMNIYGQSVHSNQHLSGDQINFLEGLEIDFGTEYKDYVLSLKRLYPILKITIEDIKDKIYVVRGLIKWCRLQERQFTMDERVSLRKKFNSEIGIY